jgi:hypothetical protein
MHSVVCEWSARKHERAHDRLGRDILPKFQAHIK